ncbi:MAG: DUF1501 domain-containing protein [Pirellulales bacterium]
MRTNPWSDQAANFVDHEAVAMLSIWESDPRNPRRVTRRTALEIGSLAVGSLTLADFLRGRAQAAKPAVDGSQTASLRARERETAVIQIFMGGGPSHIDMFDLKPDAPAEIRGPFRPISTSLPGVYVSEHLPCLARAMDKVALVRSVTHSNAGHLPASHWMMTGYEPPPSTTTNVNPSCGALVARTRGPNMAGMPAYVGIPRKQILGGSAYLGVAYNPFTTESDPVDANYAVRNLHLPRGLDASRLHDRQGLLASFDRMRADLDRDGELAGLDRFSREALEIITGTQAQAAFDIEREDAATRDRYGRTAAGQRCLLARRLVEEGVTFVTVLSGGEWDTHVNNFATLKDKSLPPFDRALAALICDLYERGLDRRVLVLVCGEFGRTPKINAQAGRDHWPGAFSVLFSGGSLRVGQVVGSTDSRAAYPLDSPYSPGDVLATVYDFLDIDTGREFPDRAGRPLRLLPAGRPIGELVS